MRKLQNQGLFPPQKVLQRQRLERLDETARVRRKGDIEENLTQVEERSLRIFKKWFKQLKVKRKDKFGYIKNVLKNLVLEVFYIDLARYSVISELRAYFQSEGADIESWNTDMIEKVIDQFQELFFVYYSYNALGMGAFTDEVMRSKIYGKEKDASPEILKELRKMREGLAKTGTAASPVEALRQRLRGMVHDGSSPSTSHIPRATT